MPLAIDYRDEQPRFQTIDPAAFDSANRRRLSGPGLRTFLTIADLWGLTEHQRRLLLGLPSRSTYHAWTRAVREHRAITLDLDVLIRISAVLGIHQALQGLHDTERDGVGWLTSANDAAVFAGQSPLAVMTAGTQDALLTVRRFLDAARGGLAMAPNAADDGSGPLSERDIRFS